MNALLTYIVKSFLNSIIHTYDNEEVDIVMSTVLLPKVHIPKIGGYVEHIIPSLSNECFKQHFRMLPSTFEYVLNQIGNELCRKADGNKMISPDKELLLSFGDLKLQIHIDQ
ncbi:uncharacterized protein LOC105829624 [Monomorium pharaonis]|uniref:uncharacterized protein LOC105829624 n=1 Tax=Monomorium pharaonis TaxID=307658 RepID=UPI00063F7388|nr:uncharacterized protein LOC105829624 [Monomorium pharaonis]